MSGLDSLHISIPDSDNNDTYNSFSRSKRSSASSVRSGTSLTSPYDPPSEFLAFNEEPIQRRSSKKGVSTFINKLFTMVEDGGRQNLISWNPSGTSFFVYNATQFAQEVLPEYFKHSNFSSFVRLLNMYGFHKINKSPRGQRGNNENEIWEFSHPKFQHGRSDILKEIKRKAMDSELLRRETGDIHASFAMLQMSQSDLLQQFYILQDNFSNLLQSFEESKKMQLQQQIIIRQLAESQGLSQGDLLQGLDSNAPNSATQSPLTVFVTSPADQQQFNNRQGWEQNNFQNSLHSPTPDVAMSIYDTSNSPSPSMSPNMFDTAVNTPLPPSPMPSVILGSPMMSMADSQQQQQENNQFQLRYDDILGVNFQAA